MQMCAACKKSPRLSAQCKYGRECNKMLQIMKREWKKCTARSRSVAALAATVALAAVAAAVAATLAVSRWGRWGWKWKWPAAAAAATMMLSSWHIVSMSDGASSPSRHFGRGQGKSINDGQQCKCFYSCHSEAVMH